MNLHPCEAKIINFVKLIVSLTLPNRAPMSKNSGAWIYVQGLN